MTVTKKYTQAEYRKLPEGFPAELLDGMFVKEPSPTSWHQTIVAEIHFRLRLLLGPNRVLESPIDVFIDEHNVLQPDLLVLAAKDRTRPGAQHVAMPVLVVEVLSPATADRDRDEKAAIYLRAGVAEVWLVDPEILSIEVRRTDGSTLHAASETAVSRAVPGFRLAFRELTD